MKEKIFEKVGRNVYVFQHIELLIKDLIELSEIKFSINENGATEKTLKEEISNKTLGQSKNKYFEQLYSSASSLKEAPEDIASISMRFRFEPDEESDAQHKQFFDKMVNERNQLIHTKLATIDFSDNDSCLDLISYLDEQFERARLVHNSLLSQRKAAVKMRKKAAEWISDDPNWPKP